MHSGRPGYFHGIEFCAIRGWIQPESDCKGKESVGTPAWKKAGRLRFPFVFVYLPRVSERKGLRSAVYGNCSMTASISRWRVLPRTSTDPRTTGLLGVRKNMPASVV